MRSLFRRLTVAVCTLALCLTSVNALSVEDALRLLEENYVDPLPAAAYESATLDELFAAIGDPYTYYMSATDSEEFYAVVENENTITGIGASIEYTANGIRITSLLDGGGAKDAGLQIDDYIVAINGISCVPAADAHRNLIIGEAGTYVTITVRHPDGTTQDYRIERRAIALHNTTVTFKDGVGTINCDSFGSQTDQYFYNGVTEHDNAELWIVDLRNNLGGLADTAVGALGVFTGFGPKLYYRLSDGSSFHTLYLSEQQTESPAIVLVNERSASASEILSGGIRAEDAGIVIGSRTYGKGSAQIVLDQERYPDLFDGDSLKVTAYRFYCSDGNTTDQIGVLPTLLVDDKYTAAVAELLSAAAPKNSDYLTLFLNGCKYYVNLEVAQSETNTDAFAELLTALPPDAVIERTAGSLTETLSAEQALAQYGNAAASRTFADVATSPYATQINTLAAYRIVTGDNGLFRPGSTLTRAELAAMLAKALNVTSNSASLFSDVSDGQWYCGDVNAMASLGFMTGIGNDRFDPYGTLTQEQLITVMGRLARFLNFHVDDYALELDESSLAGETFFVPFALWARVGASVMTGYGGNMLYTELDRIDPKAAVTREQAAATLCNMLKALDILSY